MKYEAAYIKYGFTTTRKNGSECSTCAFGSTTKAFCVSKGRCVKSNKLPQVMSLESASVEAEDDKFENEKNLKALTSPDLRSLLLISV